MPGLVSCPARTCSLAHSLSSVGTWWRAMSEWLCRVLRLSPCPAHNLQPWSYAKICQTPVRQQCQTETENEVLPSPFPFLPSCLLLCFSCSYSHNYGYVATLHNSRPCLCNIWTDSAKPSRKLISKCATELHKTQERIKRPRGKSGQRFFMT